MAKKVARGFTTEEICRALLQECIEWYEKEGKGLPSERDVCDWITDEIYYAEIVSSMDFENIHQLVFTVDGVHWSCLYERNDGACYERHKSLEGWNLHRIVATCVGASRCGRRGS